MKESSVKEAWVGQNLRLEGLGQEVVTQSRRRGTLSVKGMLQKEPSPGHCEVYQVKGQERDVRDIIVCDLLCVC